MPTLDLSGVTAPSISADPIREGGFIPSPQQEVIFDHVKNGQGSSIVIAVAGAGKTTTARKACKLMSGSVVFTSFNKKIADEISYKLREDGAGPNVSAKTFHSIGYGAWRKIAPSVRVEEDKISDICDDLAIDYKLKGSVRKLVSLVRNHGFGVGTIPLADEDNWRDIIEHFQLAHDADEDDDEGFILTLIEESLRVLKTSNATLGQVIDYDDMIYAPLLTGAPIWQNDWVLIDEAQDTNPTRQMLARRMLKPSGRLMAIGDPRQAIYGFTGASANAMQDIKDEFGCIELPLTVTYRCPKSVVREARKIVSHIEAHESAPEGEHLQMDEEGFKKLIRAKTLQRSDAVICRNTRPLITLAFEMIRNKIPCHVEGREIGRGLIALTKRWKIRNARDFMERLWEWHDEQVEKLKNKKKDREAEAIHDKVSTIDVFVKHLLVGASTDDLRREIDALFGDTPEGHPSQNLTLSTVHKAKGREWPTVYLWGRNLYMPSQYAKQEWQVEQEMNLIYVAVTRAKERLVEVSVDL
jgi:DNA helicase II / ATP-dependent DNA helicase PcrA